MQKLYENNLPFTMGLDSNLVNLHKRVEGNKAALIIIDGGVGEGKTTLAVHVADYINKISGKEKIDIDGPQMAIGGVDFLKKLRVCYEDKLPCIIYDEAGDFSKRGSLTNFNAMLNRTFETFRAFKCIVILVLPFFDVLDQDLFDKNIPRLLLHLKNRTQKYGNYYGYSLYRMQLLRARMKKMKIKNFAYSTVWGNFRGHFHDLEGTRSRELDIVSTKNKLSILRKSEVKIEGLVTYAELATKLFKSTDWVRRAVSNLKIQPARSIGRMKYFNRDVINLLTEHSAVTGDTRQKGVEPKA